MIDLILLGSSFLAISYLFFIRRHMKLRNFDVVDPDQFDFEYVSRIVKAPALRGFVLRWSCKFMNSLFGNVFFVNYMISEAGLNNFRSKKLSDLPTFYPNPSFTEKPAEVDTNSFSDADVEKLILSRMDDSASDSFDFHSMSSYLTLYKNGKLTPAQVAQRVLIGIKEISDLRAVIKYNHQEIIEMAQASTERYKSGKTLSPVDGIFVIIKDEFKVKGFVHSSGTSFLGQNEESPIDSGLVERLKSLGTIIVGIANMHELGLGTTGNNSNKGFGACRNPYNPNHYTGGSSSGSAAAVASGLCCMGLGSDGGGSVRIPSSYCGVVGLKPTFARLNLFKTSGVTNTVGHAGPICSNVRDTAVFYALLAGPHPGYTPGLHQPQIKVPDFSGDLSGMKIGIDRRYFKDCLDDVFEVCNKSLDLLRKCGATLVDVELPELRDAMLAHRIIILSEMTTSMNRDFVINFEKLTPATRIFYRLGHSVTCSDYLQANKQRTRICRFFKQAFQDLDAIVTPTAGHCAPEIVPSELESGMLNGQQDALNMRYAGVGNLTGCPAISLPVGYNDSGLPVGLQFMSAWWKEDIVLKIAECVERHVPKRKPKVFSDLLQD